MNGFQISLALFGFAILIGLGRYLHDSEKQEADQRERDLFDAECYKQRMKDANARTSRAYSSEPATTEVLKASSD